MSTVAVIGGGPAGMMAAACAAKRGHDVTLIERNEKLGKKLYLTGKGRCNITNDADIEDFFANIPRNPKFLYSALYGFSNRDIIELIERMGVPTKVERGGRVFPESDKSSDVIRALSSNLRACGVRVKLSCRVSGIERLQQGFCIHTAGEDMLADDVVLATGGASCPSTGSDGSGFALACSLGHTVSELLPSLIPLETCESWPGELSGLSLKNVVLSAYAGNKLVFSELGELLFTHFGVSGPLVLSASSRLASDTSGARLAIDLKPALDEAVLDRRIQRDFEKNARRSLANSLLELLPRRLIAVIIGLAELSPDMPVDSVTRAQRLALGAVIKHVPLTVKCARPIDEAIITRGGIPVSEINASTMGSKLVPGLYFAGEMLDVDAYTGGFNLQIAYSTGALAGSSIQ